MKKKKPKLRKITAPWEITQDRSPIDVESAVLCLRDWLNSVYLFEWLLHEMHYSEHWKNKFFDSGFGDKVKNLLRENGYAESDLRVANHYNDYCISMLEEAVLGFGNNITPYPEPDVIPHFLVDSVLKTFQKKKISCFMNYGPRLISQNIPTVRIDYKKPDFLLDVYIDRVHEIDHLVKYFKLKWPSHTLFDGTSVVETNPVLIFCYQLVSSTLPSIATTVYPLSIEHTEIMIEELLSGKAGTPFMRPDPDYVVRLP